MIRTKTKVRTNRDAAKGVERGVKRAMFDAADAGFAESQQEVPHGATSGLAQSGFEPQEDREGNVVWGYTAEYTLPVIEGSEPHWPPIDPIKRWARRVLGDESAAWAVAAKIAQEGTPAQDFISPAIRTQVARLRAEGISGFVQEEIRSRSP